MTTLMSERAGRNKQGSGMTCTNEGGSRVPIMVCRSHWVLVSGVVLFCFLCAGYYA